MKRCFKCLCEKPLDEFYKHSAMGDGRLGKCKACTKSDVKQHRQENLVRIRAYDKRRASMPHRIAQAKEIGKRWRAAHPDRKKAHTLLQAALRRGEVKKTPCWVCGGSSEAHHPDYSRPLDVVWLCSPHHKQAHAIAR